MCCSRWIAPVPRQRLEQPLSSARESSREHLAPETPGQGEEGREGTRPEPPTPSPPSRTPSRRSPAARRGPAPAAPYPPPSSRFPVPLPAPRSLGNVVPTGLPPRGHGEGWTTSTVMHHAAAMEETGRGARRNAGYAGCCSSLAAAASWDKRKENYKSRGAVRGH